ncbi:MAG: protein-glutamate O-methyltransferase CheR [Spirochaetota bacterium]|nr:protein-glutamate O-methyltransferase CheR [Spirochaetota bacterium]
MENMLKIDRLTETEFKKFADLIYKESGIFLKPTKITLVSNRLRKRLKVLNLKTFTEYYDYINNMSNKTNELENLLDVVSTNETYFFRNERHFNALNQFCLPALASRKKNEKRLRIWSAGCSTGEEPYTLAICIMENINLFNGWDIEILATDIAPSVLKFAQEGEYSGRRIEKVPENILKKYFIQDKEYPEIFTINNNIKKIVRFSSLNLFKDTFPQRIDIIFCRNVMIYFDKEHQKKLISGFNKSLLRDGFFFIGHSETLHSISEDFVYKKIVEAPVYVKKESLDAS